MDEKIQKRLDALMKIYSKNLPDKIHKIEMLWEEQKQHWDLVQFQNFHREVHSLCGSAGTYGYPELSKTARQLEVFLKSIINKGQLSNNDKEVIPRHLNQIKTTAYHEKQRNELPFQTQLTEEIDNRYIYIVEQDEVLLQQLKDSLKQTGFSPFSFQDIFTLQLAVKEKTPIAIIIDTQYLDETGAQSLLELQNQQSTLIQLFCILPNAELAPRLVAIRSGCDAFFQKPVDIYQITQIINHKCGATPGQPYRILIIDDSKALAEYYSLILNQAGMTAKAITNPMDLLKELDVFQPNLLLMDVYMPECTGFELAAVLRQESNYTKIPIIFLSTEEDKDKKLFAISLGGDDFLTKPISPQHLISAVRSRSKRASILNYYMTTDSLSGLLNHSSILKQFEIQLTRAQLANLPLSIAIIDIDHFKKVNDTYGHQVGDEVIKKLSSLLLSRLRNQDIVGRYGGEEFVLILPGATSDDATKITNNLRVQFSQYEFRADNQDFSVTFSVGISCLRGMHSAAEMIKHADYALYQAKNIGRNQVVVFQEK